MALQGITRAMTFASRNLAKLEFLIIPLALFAKFLIAAYAIQRGLYNQQDWHVHGGLIHDFKSWSVEHINPPLLYFFANKLLRLSLTKPYALEIASYVLVLLNIAATWVFYQRIVRVYLTRSSLRISCMLLLILLPVFSLHQTMLNPDALTVPVFIGMVLAIHALVQNGPTTIRELVKYTLLALAAVLSKYTLITSVMAGGVAIIWTAWRKSWNKWPIAAWVLGGIVLPGMIFSIIIWSSSQRNGYTTHRHFFEQDPPAGMNIPFQHLFIPRPLDREIFAAPRGCPGGGPLTKPDSHSYIALLHYSAFSDLYDTFWPGNHQCSEEPRTENRRRIMALSIGLGLLFSLFAIAGTLYFSFSLGRTGRYLKNEISIQELLALFSLAYFLLIALNLPRVPLAVQSHYWHGRLVMPALFSFFALGFFYLDKILAFDANSSLDRSKEMAVKNCVSGILLGLSLVLAVSNVLIFTVES